MESMRNDIVGSLNAMASVVEDTQVPTLEPTPAPSLNAAQQPDPNQALLLALQDMKLEFAQALQHINNNKNNTHQNGGEGRFHYRRNTNCYS